MQKALEQEKTICNLAESLTGANPYATRPAIVASVLRLAKSAGYEALNDYLHMAQREPSERQKLLSCLTVHTTSWFREVEHFDFLRQHLQKKCFAKDDFRVLSAGCSTGEEAFSMALILDESQGQGFISSYQVEGWDIDSLSLQTARLGDFSIHHLRSIPLEYHALLNIKEETFQVQPRLRLRVGFHEVNLLATETYSEQQFQLIFCKNILIYLAPETALNVMMQLSERLCDGGLLLIGLGESVDLNSCQSLKRIGHAVFQKIF